MIVLRPALFGMIALLAVPSPRSPAPIAEPIDVNIKGVVFVDYDRDGRIDPGEQAADVLDGISVTIVNGADEQVLTTNETGEFTGEVSMVGADIARLSFATPDGHHPTFIQDLGLQSAQSGSAVQFRGASDLRTPVTYGIVPNSRCPDNPDGVGAPSAQSPAGNPNSFAGKVWTTCYVEGARTSSLGAQDVLVGANFDTSGWTPAADANNFGGNIEIEHIGQRDQLGSLWGVAYDEWDGMLFTSAVIKRHADLGPSGVDGLYWVQADVDATSRDATAIDLDTLSPPDAPSYGDDPTDCPRDVTGEYAYDGFAASTSVPGGRWDCRDLDSADLGSRSYDWWAFDRTGREGIGDIDITPDGNRLLVMNATADAVFVYDLTSGTPVYDRHHELFDPDCADDEFEAWAVSAVDAATAYIGITCTASTSGLGDDLRAHVISLDIDDGSQQRIATAQLDAPRGAGWTDQAGPKGGTFQPWLASGPDQPPALPPVEELSAVVFSETDNAWVYANGLDYHQPLLTDIELDPLDGSLVLAITDRWAMMTGVFGCDLDPATSGCRFVFPAPPIGDYDDELGDDDVASYNAGIIGYNAGDVLRICNTGSGFVLEGGLGCDPSPFSPVFEPQFGGGPAGAIEWYWNDQAFESVQTENPHPEAAQGAVYIGDRRNDVVYTAMNPVETFGAGLSWDMNADGANRQALQFFRTDLANRDGTGFKSASLGDVEGCTIPIEVGGRLWFDDDANGVQGGEPAIGGMAVDLIEVSTGRVVAQTLSNEEGIALFGSPDGLLPTTDYVLEFAVTDETSVDGVDIDRSELRVTMPGATTAEFDSDVVGTRIEFTTGLPGENDHSLDAGFGRVDDFPNAPELETRDASEVGQAGAVVADETPVELREVDVTRTIIVVVALLALFSIVIFFALRWSWNRE